MAKKLIQDIFVKKEKERPSLREELKESAPAPRRASSSTGYSSAKTPLLKKPVFWVVLVLFVSVTFFFVATSFGTVTLAIAPRTVAVTVDDTYSGLNKDATSAVHFEVMKVSDTESVDIPSTGISKVSKSASGTLIVYNNYDSQPQKLVAGTRFATSDGKIYKADTAITVPGQTVSGGTKKAGSVEVRVTAAAPGESYNIGLSDFTIPGFQGSPRYTGFYARSKTPMTGGLVGNQPVAKDSDITAAKNKLATDLKESLLERAKKELAEGYLFYEGSDFFNVVYSQQASASSTNSNSLTLSAQGSLYGIILNRVSLAKAIASKKITDYAGEEVDISDPNNLNLTILAKDGVNPETATALSLQLTGSAHIIWLVNEAQLAKDLAGISKNDYVNVLKKYPSIDHAEATFSPPWLWSFPSRSADIHLEHDASK
jgi:hypothetical protein